MHMILVGTDHVQCDSYNRAAQYTLLHKGLAGTFDLILYVDDGHINVYAMNHS